MASYDYDLFVIGAGSAGVRCARIAAGLGAKVVVAENRYLGGTCVNVGCVPKKMFVYASEFTHSFKTAKGYGWDIGDATFDWRTFIDKKTAEIERLNGVYNTILERSGAEIIHGSAQITGPNSVSVNGVTYSCERIVIAVGGWPKKGDYPGAEHTITSNEVFSLEHKPKRVLVEGGGYIAVEFAGIFNGLGVDVDLVYRGELFLRGFDQDIRRALADTMKSAGVNLVFNTTVQSIEKSDDGLTVAFSDGQTRTYDQVLSAVGRRPMTDDLGLASVDVQVNPNGTIIIDENFKTTAKGIYALGDVVGRMALTPVALEEGMALANHLFSNTPINFNYQNIPTAVFTQPEIATVGLTLEQAQNNGIKVVEYKSHFKPLIHTISGLDDRVMMKLVVEEQTNKVLGCHMLGDHAGEILQGVAIAINMGATKADFDKTVGIHPTAAEEFVTMR